MKTLKICIHVAESHYPFKWRSCCSPETQEQPAKDSQNSLSHGKSDATSQVIVTSATLLPRDLLGSLGRSRSQRLELNFPLSPRLYALGASRSFGTIFASRWEYYKPRMETDMA